MKNIIEINGRKYDAQTGRLVTGGISKLSNTHSQTIFNANKSKLVDGVRKNNSSTHPHQSIPAVVNKLDPRPIQSNSSKKTLDGFHKKTQRSTTLARKVVKKPTKTVPNIHSKSLPSDKLNHIPLSVESKSSMFKRVPEARLTRAISQTTSSAISKFSMNKPIRPTLNDGISVKNPPTETPKSTLKNINATAPKSAHSANFLQRQVFDHSVKQASTKHSQHSITNLTSIGHKKTYHKKIRTKRYLTGVVAACFAFLLLGSFLAYQKVPQIAIKVAARNTGFNAKVPSAIPSGYSYKSPVQAKKDSLAINYKSSTDSRHFTITQQPTSWTSESLLSNFLVNSKREYQTYYDKGLTVFVYDNNSAAWVDKGIWYTIQSYGSLSSEQILSIASSI